MAEAVLDAIATMASEDRAPAERAHVTVTTHAPDLAPRTRYGMHAPAAADGRVVVVFQDAGRFAARYATLGFQGAANLDDGDTWPTSHALTTWDPRWRRSPPRCGPPSADPPQRDPRRAGRVTGPARRRSGTLGRWSSRRRPSTIRRRRRGGSTATSAT